jgi:hypothetical protein
MTAYQDLYPDYRIVWDGVWLYSVISRRTGAEYGRFQSIQQARDHAIQIQAHDAKKVKPLRNQPRDSFDGPDKYGS